MRAGAWFPQPAPGFGGDWKLLAGQEVMLGWSSVRLGAVPPLAVILILLSPKISLP